MRAKQGLIFRAVLGFFCLCIPPAAAVTFSQTNPRVLVFTRTQGFDHGTRTVADSLIRALGAKTGFDVDTTDDTGAYFKDAKLKTYATVCFINVTGTIFNDSTKAAFQRYIQGGGGYVGMHAAVDCEYTWHWYHQMAGAYFANHQCGIATAKLAILDHGNPSTSFFTSDTITHSDEWYFFTPQTYDSTINPAIEPNFTVLMNLVESSMSCATSHLYHPICWCQQFDGGRSWYCGFGHYPDYFRDTIVQKTLLGGIMWTGRIGTSSIVRHEPVFAPANASGPIEVYDVFGRKIRTLGPGSFGFRGSIVQWNHRDNSGNPVAAGLYYMIRRQGTVAQAGSLVFVK